MGNYVKHEPSERKPKEKPQSPQEPVKTRERTGTAVDYGRYYWCVKTDLSENGDIYVYADEVRYTPTGAVVFVSRRDDGVEQTNLALAAGQWTAVYAASCWDGGAVAVEHWESEVAR